MKTSIQPEVSKMGLSAAVKHYLINRCLAGLIHILGLFAPTCKAKKLSVNGRLLIRAGSIADFEFFYMQVRQAEGDGSFNSTAGYNTRLVKEGYYRQFLMTVKLGRMIFPVHGEAPAVFITAIYDGHKAGFVWLKQFQGLGLHGWEIYLLSVDENFRKLGIADALIKYSIGYIESYIAQDIYVRIKKSIHARTMYRILCANGFSHFEALRSESGARIYFKPCNITHVRTCQEKSRL